VLEHTHKTTTNPQEIESMEFEPFSLFLSTIITASYIHNFARPACHTRGNIQSNPIQSNDISLAQVESSLPASYSKEYVLLMFFSSSF